MTGEGASPLPTGAAPQVLCAHDALVPVRDLRAHPANPNRHPDEQVALLANVIRGNGWRVPITVSSRSGYIVRGHARAAAARLLGLAVAPVDRQDYPDEAAELADLVADNKVAELADMDYQAVAAILRDIPADAHPLTAYRDFEIGPLLAAVWGGGVEPGDDAVPRGAILELTVGQAVPVRAAIAAVRLEPDCAGLADGAAVATFCRRWAATEASGG